MYKLILICFYFVSTGLMGNEKQGNKPVSSVTSQSVRGSSQSRALSGGRSSSCTDSDRVAEFAKLQQIYNEVIDALETEFPYLGWGWCGNMTGLGPKCDQVSDAFARIIRPKLRAANFRCLTVVNIFDSGPLPGDLCAHVYFGVKHTGEDRIILYLDPWRYGTDKNIWRFKCPNKVESVAPLN